MSRPVAIMKWLVCSSTTETTGTTNGEEEPDRAVEATPNRHTSRHRSPTVDRGRGRDDPRTPTCETDVASAGRKRPRHRPRLEVPGRAMPPPGRPHDGRLRAPTPAGSDSPLTPSSSSSSNIRYSPPPTWRDEGSRESPGLWPGLFRWVARAGRDSRAFPDTVQGSTS